MPERRERSLLTILSVHLSRVAICHETNNWQVQLFGTFLADSWLVSTNGAALSLFGTPPIVVDADVVREPSPLLKIGSVFTAGSWKLMLLGRTNFAVWELLSWERFPKDNGRDNNLRDVVVADLIRVKSKDTGIDVTIAGCSTVVFEQVSVAMVRQRSFVDTSILQ